MRSGLWMSGSGGSGVLIARKADGTWSPPSGILLHTAALGFVVGVDIYDCVLVINSVAVLELFTRPRLVLGTDVSLTVGPLARVSSLDQEVIRWKELENTVLTYLKARGQHQGVHLDGSLVTERGNENERFYGGDVNVLDILAGNIPKSVPETRPLFEVIKAAEGRTDFDMDLMVLLSQQPAPGDAVIEALPSPSALSSSASPVSGAGAGSATTTTSTSKPFGIPDKDDPDPFGVIALEMAGLEIRQAGTRLRPASSQFEFNPSPTSPLFGRLPNRQSVDTYASRSNRGSCMSAKTQGTAMTDACTQTDVGSGTTPETATSSSSHANSEAGPEDAHDDHDAVVAFEKLTPVMEPEEIDYTKIDSTAIELFSRPHSEEQLAPPVEEVLPLSEDDEKKPDTSESAADSSSNVNNNDPAKEEKQELELERVPEERQELEQVPEEEPELEPEPEPKQQPVLEQKQEKQEKQEEERAEEADDADDEDDEEEEGDAEEEPVIFEVATAAQPARATIRASQLQLQSAHVIQAKGALVTIPKRVAPPLPLRSPARASRASKSDYGDVSSLVSPVRSSFHSAMSARSQDAAATIPSPSSPPPPSSATTTAPTSRVSMLAARFAAKEAAVEPGRRASMGELRTNPTTLMPPPPPRNAQRWSMGSTTSNNNNKVAAAVRLPPPLPPRTAAAPASAPSPQAADLTLASSSASEESEEREPRTPAQDENFGAAAAGAGAGVADVDDKTQSGIASIEEASSPHSMHSHSHSHSSSIAALTVA